MDASSDSRKLVTIVCPVFNEEHAVPLFYERLAKSLASIEDRVRFEVLFVNNRSTDGTEAAVMALHAKDPRVQLLTLSRNYGYQASISAKIIGVMISHASRNQAGSIGPPSPSSPPRWRSWTRVETYAWSSSASASRSHRTGASAGILTLCANFVPSSRFGVRNVAHSAARPVLPGSTGRRGGPSRSARSGRGR